MIKKIKKKPNIYLTVTFTCRHCRKDFVYLTAHFKRRFVCNDCLKDQKKCYEPKYYSCRRLLPKSQLSATEYFSMLNEYGN